MDKRLFVEIPYDVALDLLSEHGEQWDGTNKFDAFYRVLKEVVQNYESCGTLSRLNHFKAIVSQGSAIVDTLSECAQLSEDDALEIRECLQDIDAILDSKLSRLN